MSNFLKQIQREIKRLSREKDSFERRIRTLELLYAEYIRGESLLEKKIKREDGMGQGRVDKIVRIFKKEMRPLHYREIVELLEKNEGEKLEDVKDKGATITATLSLHRDLFKRVKKGTYVLIEDAEKISGRPEESL